MMQDRLKYLCPEEICRRATLAVKTKRIVKDGEDIPEILSLKREVEDWIGTFPEPWIKD